MTKWFSPRLQSDAGLTVLFASLIIALFVVYPFVPLGRPGRLVVTSTLTILLVSGSFSLADRRRLFTATLGLASIALSSHWLCHVIDDPRLLVFASLSAIAFLTMTAGGILSKVIRPGQITTHRLQGAVAVYLLLGLIWAFAYALLEHQQPGSFRLPARSGEVTSPSDGMGDFVYFSFVTLTTLGYGDISPSSAAARNMTIAEALTGQLYLVILIAHLVSLRVATAASTKEPQSS